MKTILLAILSIIGMSCFAQKPINTELKKQLDTILQTDQGIREFVDSEVKEKRKEGKIQLLSYSTIQELNTLY